MSEELHQRASGGEQREDTGGDEELGPAAVRHVDVGRGEERHPFRHPPPYLAPSDDERMGQVLQAERVRQPGERDRDGRGSGERPGRAADEEETTPQPEHRETDDESSVHVAPQPEQHDGRPERAPEEEPREQRGEGQAHQVRTEIDVRVCPVEEYAAFDLFTNVCSVRN